MPDIVTGPALTLAGLDVPVVEGTWVRKPSLYLGARIRTAYGNRAISTERQEIRVFECQVDCDDQTEEDALRSACPRGQPLLASGYLLPESFEVLVDIGDTTTVTVDIDGSLTILRTANLHIEEHHYPGFPL